MENKKGSGVFLGVVSVATLIVAIIGATFAYFSATVNSETDAINVTAYKFDFAAPTIEKIKPGSSNQDAIDAGIIPLKASLLGTALTKDCVDDNGYEVCEVYKVTLENNGTQSETLTLSVKTTSNNLEDLTFRMLGSSAAAVDNNYAAVKLPTDSTTTLDVVDTSSNAYQITVASEDSGEFYFVVYLDEPRNAEDTDDKDQSTQMGNSYTGQIILTSANGSNRLTGTFN